MMPQPDVKGHVLAQEQIKATLQQLGQARTQEETIRIQQQVKKMVMVEKNFGTMVAMVLAKDVDLSTKTLIMSSFNLVVQQFLKKYQNIRNKAKSKQAYRHIEELRKQITNVSTKLEKIIDSQIVPFHLKPNIILLQIKLCNRSKQDWDSARLAIKMEYYFRKDQITLAIPYFTSIYKLGFSIKEKFQLIRKVITMMPTSAAKCLTKIVQAETRDRNAYADFNCVFEQMLNVLRNGHKEITNEIVLQWCNSQIFVNMLKTLAQETVKIHNPTSNQMGHPAEEVREWSNMLIELLRGLTINIYHHRLMGQCENFLQFYTLYIAHAWQFRYIDSLNNHPSQFPQLFGDYLTLFINGIKMGVSQAYFAVSSSDETVSDGKLVMDEKIYLLKNCVLVLEKYFYYRMHDFLTTNSQQTKKQFLQLFEDLCNTEGQEEDSENFAYNLSLFFLTLNNSCKRTNYFIKSMIQCLFTAQERQNGDKWWLRQQYMLISEISRTHQERLDLGVLMCLLLYRNLVIDRYFIDECVGSLIWNVSAHVDDPEVGLFRMGDNSIMLFLLLLQSYMEEVPVFTIDMSRIKEFRLSGFIKTLIAYLSAKANKMGGLETICISVIKKYIQLVKCIISQYKLSDTYQSYSKNIKFTELQAPLQQFHNLQFAIPITHYAELYEHIIAFDLFRIEEEKQEQTIARVKTVLEGIIKFQDHAQYSQAYAHSMFRIFTRVCECPEYVPLMGQLFAWVQKLVTSSKQASLEFEQDMIDLCLAVLKKSHTVSAMDKQTLHILWQMVFNTLNIYEWKQYTTEAEIAEPNNQDPCCYISQDSFTAKQLLLFYLVSGFQIPAQLKDLVFKKSGITLLAIMKLLGDKKRQRLIAKYRPYQIQEISFLLTLHQLIATQAEEINRNLAIIEELLKLFWTSYQFRLEFPDDFNYVNGKYNLIVLLLMKHCSTGVWGVLEGKGQQIVNKIYLQLFYNDVSYRVQYDSPIFVVTTVDLVRRLWQTSHRLDEYLLKYAHFAVGAGILCMDRVYENYRHNFEQELEIEVFKKQIKDPILQTDIKTTKFIQFLTQNQPYIDQFDYFQQFYRKLEQNEEVFEWFVKAMETYTRSQIYMDFYYTVLTIRKIRKANGLIMYRICKRVRENTE